MLKQIYLSKRFTKLVIEKSYFYNNYNNHNYMLFYENLPVKSELLMFLFFTIFMYKA